ncbi:MAG: DnaJ domain-containing protein [Desulfobacteraceae bacterium]|nr:DnaJ domain-containing protein [Desulfobacteraceae bacterium]
METKDYYIALGVSPDATKQQIKEAYRCKAFEFHPDRNRDDANAAQMMQIVNEAYAVLSDEGKRRQYDHMRQFHGDEAHQQFRQTFSQQDIFKNTDIDQIFEEMARAFGVRGFDQIFKDLHGQSNRSFQPGRQSVRLKRFAFRVKQGQRSGKAPGPAAPTLLGAFAHKAFTRLTGVVLPQRGSDIYDTIVLRPEFAAKGGAYPYYHRSKDKKLVVKIPSNVKNGQQIRLADMGNNGQGGAQNGNLYLTVKIKQPFIGQVKKLFGLKK